MIKQMKFTILKDTKEQQGWEFEPYSCEKYKCLGMERAHLDTGDYTIKEFKGQIAIERKKTTGELSLNIFEPRFEKELIRLEEYKYPFMIFEFTYDDVKNFPVNSGIPQKIWYKLKMTPKIMEDTIAKYQIKYKTKIIFAGEHGKSAMIAVLDRIIKYGDLKC